MLEQGTCVTLAWRERERWTSFRTRELTQERMIGKLTWKEYVHVNDFFLLTSCYWQSFQFIVIFKWKKNWGFKLSIWIFWWSYKWFRYVEICFALLRVNFSAFASQNEPFRKLAGRNSGLEAPLHAVFAGWAAHRLRLEGQYRLV